jgi:hypothetical protein
MAMLVDKVVELLQRRRQREDQAVVDAREEYRRLMFKLFEEAEPHDAEKLLIAADAAGVSIIQIGDDTKALLNVNRLYFEWEERKSAIESKSDAEAVKELERRYLAWQQSAPLLFPEPSPVPQ